MVGWCKCWHKLIKALAVQWWLMLTMSNECRETCWAASLKHTFVKGECKASIKVVLYRKAVWRQPLQLAPCVSGTYRKSIASWLDGRPALAVGKLGRCLQELILPAGPGSPAAASLAPSVQKHTKTGGSLKGKKGAGVVRHYISTGGKLAMCWDIVIG